VTRHAAPGLEALDQKLDPQSPRPIAVAYSGGGDSLAALISVTAWAARHGRPVIALHVDHGLQAASPEWARLARRNALALGASFHGLSWTGDKPAKGLAAAARRARHSLIAEAARDLGARVIVFGHTADDEREAALMRAEGRRQGRLAVWRPSPVWPQGRGLFLLRPLLSARRADLRAGLACQGLAWIDDPANEDPRSARARARARLARMTDEAAAPETADDPGLVDLVRRAQTPPDGSIHMDRARFAQAPLTTRARFLAAALTCVAGAEQPPRAERLRALMARLDQPGPVIATLAGAKLVAAENILLVREAGAFRRYGTPAMPLDVHSESVWDGRFAISGVGSAGLAVAPLAGATKLLPKIQQVKLSTLSREVRPGLPMILAQDGGATCPILAEGGTVRAKSLVAARLIAVCGLISNESEI